MNPNLSHHITISQPASVRIFLILSSRVNLFLSIVLHDLGFPTAVMYLLPSASVYMTYPSDLLASSFNTAIKMKLLLSLTGILRREDVWSEVLAPRMLNFSTASPSTAAAKNE